FSSTHRRATADPRAGERFHRPVAVAASIVPEYLTLSFLDNTRLFKGVLMDRSPAFGSTTTPGTSSTNTNAKVESAAMAAHQATDRITDSATTKVDQLSGTAH